MDFENFSAKEAVKVYKALGEPARLNIVRLLFKHSELSCVEIADQLDIKAPTLSHHLKQLVDCGLLELSRKAGTYHYYKMNQDALKYYVATT